MALSYEREQLKFSEDTNLNEIYADLLDAVYERGYEGKRGHIAIQGLKKYEFFGILEDIALACWHGDGRTTTIGEIEKHCQASGFKQILERFQQSLKEDSRASITRLLTAFYFRESGDIRGTEKTFEFTHKSFGEYLTARRIVEGLKLIQEELEERNRNPRKGCDLSEALLIWLKLCGESAMNEYLFDFIVDEIRLQNLEFVQEWQKTLCKLIEFMLTHGMPLEGLEERPRFQEEMRLARNSEEALLVVLSACARVTEKSSKIQWPSNDIFGAWISRLQGQTLESERVIFAIKCLTLLDLQQSKLPCKDFYEASFYEANLYGANLYGTNLYRANLEGAHLEGAHLEGANLEEANLKGANLKGANFTEANLKGANLKGANLTDANFEGTILEGKDIDVLTTSSEENE